MKISRSRSSSTPSSSDTSSSSVWSSSRPSCSCFASRVALRRNRSIARCLAVAMSQAPGLSGTPDSGHCSSAATSASCARSSARATSRVSRVSPAISRADSMRQTAWTAACGSAPIDRRLRVRLDLLAQALLGLAQLRRQVLAEVVGLEDLPDLDLGVALHRVRAALDPLDGLLHRADLPQPEARDQLLGLRERAVHDAPVGAAEAHPRTLGAGVEPLAGEHDAGLRELLVVLAHRLEQLRARHLAGFALGGGLDHDHDAHRMPPGVGSRSEEHTSELQSRQYLVCRLLL